MRALARMIRPLEIERSLDLARKWLTEVSLHAPSSGCGWPMVLGQEELVVWGGTVDGIRALTALGVPPTSPLIVGALEWLGSQQEDEGGFTSCEIDYSSAESTAWVLITLGELGMTTHESEIAERGMRYLVRCIDERSGSVQATPSDAGKPRTMSTALALWAISCHPERQSLQNLLIERLKTTQDPNTSGWGVSFSAVPNIATTAQAVHALCTAGVSREAEWLRNAADYLAAQQEENGGWKNGYDEWFISARPRTPYRCLNYSSGWSLLALSHFGHHEARHSCRRTVLHLLEVQRPDGSWLYEDSSPLPHIWCTSQVAIALKRWRDLTAAVGSSPVGLARAGHDAVSDVLGRWGARLREFVLPMLLAWLVLRDCYDEVRNALAQLIAWSGIDRDGIVTNLFSTLTGWFLVLLFGWLIKTTKRR